MTLDTLEVKLEGEKERREALAEISRLGQEIEEASNGTDS